MKKRKKTLKIPIPFICYTFQKIIIYKLTHSKAGSPDQNGQYAPTGQGQYVHQTGPGGPDAEGYQHVTGQRKKQLKLNVAMKFCKKTRKKKKKIKSPSIDFFFFFALSRFFTRTLNKNYKGFLKKQHCGNLTGSTGKRTIKSNSVAAKLELAYFWQI